MKYFATQIAPEKQESPLQCGCASFLPNEMIITGNCHFKEYDNEVFMNLHWNGAFSDGLYESSTPEEVRNVVEKWIPTCYHKCTDFELTTLQTLQTLRFEYEDNYNLYDDSINSRHYEDKDEEEQEQDRDEYLQKQSIISARMLSIVFGCDWATRKIEGATKEQWTYIYYPVSLWNEERLTNLVTEYFNLGTEWIIADENHFNPETGSPADVSGMRVYVPSTDMCYIRNWLANTLTDCEASDLTLYKFDHYEQTPVHTLVVETPCELTDDETKKELLEDEDLQQMKQALKSLTDKYCR